MDRLLLGLPDLAASSSFRSTTGPRPTSSRRCAAWSTRASCWSATTSTTASCADELVRPAFRVWQLRRPRLARRRADAGRRRSRATTSSRSSSRRARRPSRRASSSATATCSPTSSRSSARSLKYRKYARPFHPLRFLNLLPLSHMFGQSMATNIPPMVRGTVIFTRSFNPHDILRLIKSRRVSVLVCVPKILDVLREHVDPRVSGGGRAAARGHLDPGPLVAVPARPLGVRPEVLGLRRRRGAAAAGPRGVLAAHRLRRHPGLRADRDRADRHAQSSVQDEQGIGRHADRRRRVRIADDGEILVRGENVTSGYYEDPRAQANPEARSPESRQRVFDADGWLHTGDIGERDAQGRVFIKGRKKEMIVTPDGLNVFPEDVERVLERAARRPRVGGRRRRAMAPRSACTRCWCSTPGADRDAVIRARQRAAPGSSAHPRGVGLADRRPAAHRRHAQAETRARSATGCNRASGRSTAARGDTLEALIARFAHGRDVSGATTLEELGLSSLERVELMVALEDRFQTRLDEGRFSEAASVADLKQLVEAAAGRGRGRRNRSTSRRGTARGPCGSIRRLSLATWILPLARVFAWARVEGLEHLRDLEGPVIFAVQPPEPHGRAGHSRGAAGAHRARASRRRWRRSSSRRISFPTDTRWRERFTNSLNYYLAAFYFNAFPLPQREAGARQTLQLHRRAHRRRWSILIFPEGRGRRPGHIKPFRGGIGMIGVPARRPGRARPARRCRSRAAPDGENGDAGPGSSGVRRTAASAAVTTTRHWPREVEAACDALVNISKSLHSSVARPQILCKSCANRRMWHTHC